MGSPHTHWRTGTVLLKGGTTDTGELHEASGCSMLGTRSAARVYGRTECEAGNSLLTPPGAHAYMMR